LYCPATDASLSFLAVIRAAATVRHVSVHRRLRRLAYWSFGAEIEVVVDLFGRLLNRPS
jgi:hypothetical protein